MRWLSLALLLGSVIHPVAARSADVSPPPALATADGIRITAADLQARIDAAPERSRSAYASAEARRELLEAMIVHALIAREAARARGDAGTGTAEDDARLEVQRYLQRRFHDPDGPASVPEAEVRRYYDEHLDAYRQPVRMAVSWITFEAPEGSSRREAIRRRAADLRARIVGSGTAPEAFAGAVEEVTRAANPEVVATPPTLLSLEKLARLLTAEIADAAWALAPGEVSPLLASPRGFHLLQGSGGQPARDVTLDQARGGIRIVLYQARMAEAFRRWVAELRERADVRIDGEQLARVGPRAPTPSSAVAR